VPSPAVIQNSAKIRTVFLDRDGVINRKAPEGEYIRSVGELEVLPGVPQAVARLNGAGLRTIVLSNQRGIAKGLYSAEDVEAIHEAIQRALARHGAKLDAFFVCPHDKDQCLCRKPLPGMFEQAVKTFCEVRADESVMIGDSLVDIEFGRRLGMRTILVGDALELDGDDSGRTGLHRPGLNRPGLDEAVRLADRRVDSLPAAVDLLLSSGFRRVSETDPQ